MSKKRILYIQYSNPGVYPPLDHSAQILASAGSNIRFLGIAIHPKMVTTAHPNIQVQLLPSSERGWRQKVHYLLYAVWVCFYSLVWRPQWIYASDPLIAPIALLLTYFPGPKVLYHEHDSPGTPLNVSWFMRFILTTRKWLAQRTALNVLPNLERGQIFQEQTGVAQAPTIVWNCPRLEEVLPPAENNYPPMRLLYHGSIVPERLPLTALDALALLPQTVSLHVYGYETGNSGYVARLKQYAQQKGIASRVYWHGLLSRHDLMQETDQYHVGLALLPRTGGDINLRQMIGASNKVFDYMARGVPVLVNAMEPWISEIVEAGYGRACEPESPESVARELCWYLEHPYERQGMGEAGRAKVLNEWNYETQFQPVLNLLNTTLL